MHSVMDPAEESRILYAQQTAFRETASGNKDEDFVIWDVGMGAASNVMAALREYEKITDSGLQMRNLVIYSFENDLDPLKLAVKNPSLFPHVRHAAPGSIITSGRWSSKNYPVEWVLIKGGFPETIRNARQPHCIYYDPFSLNTDSSLWSVETFSTIRDFCAGRTARLFTYSSSTAVRAALLAAGFYTGKGPGTGPKNETTTAITSIEYGTFGIELLGTEWLEKYSRSSSKYITGHDEGHRQSIDAAVAGHPQFRRKP